MSDDVSMMLLVLCSKVHMYVLDARREDIGGFMTPLTQGLITADHVRIIPQRWNGNLHLVFPYSESVDMGALHIITWRIQEAWPMYCVESKAPTWMRTFDVMVSPMKSPNVQRLLQQ